MKTLPAGGRLLAMDETTLRLLPPLRAAWALRGEQAQVPISGKNASGSLFGTVDLHTGRRVIMISSQQRLADIARFLRRLRAGAGAKGALWLLLDAHSTHASPATLRLADKLNIRLLWLPKQSPKLNPMDHLWRGLKGELAANRQFAHIDELARYAQAWVYRLTPTQTLCKAGLLSENCWLKQLRKTLWPRTYHVMCRGDCREAIYADDRDRETFIQTLAQMCARTGQRVHSYVLMSNHYHLLLETPEANLVAGMKWFQGAYTQRYNVRHRVGGHLFQGRYKAVPVDTETTDYFRAVSDYIHLSPVRARMLAGESVELEQYSWSSYPAFIGSMALPPWLQRGRVFASLGLETEGAAARRRYRGWMATRTCEALERDPTQEEEQQWRELRRGWYLGSDGFRDRLMDWAAGVTAGHKRCSYRRREGLARHDMIRAEELLAEGLRLIKLGEEEMIERKQSDAAKQALAWLVKSQTVMGDEWVGKRLQMGHRSNVSRAVRAFRAPRDALRKKLKKLLHICTDSDLYLDFSR